jgi:hypothetical protein
MNVATLNKITTDLTLYAPCIILLFGNIGCLFNLLTFQTKELRKNSCGWYFLMSSITDLFLINFGLITKFSSDALGSNLYNTSRIYCKIRIFLTWTFPCISTCYLVLASLDRCLSTSENSRLRLFSRIRVAHRITLIPIIVYSLTNCHEFIYFDLRPKCVAESGIYSIFISIYSIVWTSLIPQSLLLIFGLITYRNIRLSRKRLQRENEERRSRTDIHLIKMTFFQVIISSILLNIRTIYFSYSVLSANVYKSERQIAFESLLLQISSFVFFINFCKSFYINTLTSKLFRQVLFKRLIRCFHRITTLRKSRVHPTITIRYQPTQFNQIITRKQT